jgi:hypothetical protein
MSNVATYDVVRGQLGTSQPESVGVDTDKFSVRIRDPFCPAASSPDGAIAQDFGPVRRSRASMTVGQTSIS